MEKITKYFVVTLIGGPREARWQNIDFVDIFAAIDTRDNPLQVVKEYGFSFNLGKWRRCFRKEPGAFGCYLSHYLIWEHVAKSRDDKHYCVLEDDVKLDAVNNFHGSNYIPDRDIVKLSHRLSGPFGTEAYAINRSGANMLIDETNKTITAPVDRFMWGLKNKHSQLYGQARRIGLDPIFRNSTLKPKNE